MTLDQIQVFLAVAEKGSLSAASKTLGRSQPTLSVALKNLEEQLGVLLFSREGYRMSLSKVGEQLLPQARFLLQQASAFERSGKYFSKGFEPELRVSIDPMIPLRPILEVLKSFEQRYQQTQLTLVSQYMSGGVEKLLSEEVDLAFVALPEEQEPIESFQVGQVAVRNLISPQFSLNQGVGPITLDQLRAQPQIIIKDSAAHPSETQFNVLEGGRRWSVTDAQTKKELILAAMGWGSLPLHLVSNELEIGSLVPLGVTGFSVLTTIPAYLAKKKGGHLAPVALELWKEFQRRSAQPGSL